MLTAEEKSGLMDILKTVDEKDLYCIFETVTKRMIEVKNCNEAMEKILSCTVKPSDLLRRQKMTKKVLFRYLVQKGLEVNPDQSKSTYVKKCLELWQSSDVCEERDYDDVEMVCGQPTDVPSRELVVQLGSEFSRWFFPLLNTLNDFRPEHFWPECSLLAVAQSQSEQKEVRLFGADQVVAFLSNLVVVEKFHFDASHDTVTSELEQHGLMRLVVGGVLHCSTNCLGLFDFAFGLVRNPACDYVWKIKCIQLKLQLGVSPLQRTLPTDHYPSLCQTV